MDKLILIGMKSDKPEEKVSKNVNIINLDCKNGCFKRER